MGCIRTFLLEGLYALRLPSSEGNLDNIVGVVTVRDLVRELHYTEGYPSSGAWSSRRFTSPGQKNTDELLEEMRDNRLQMVIVIDEFGTTEGIITLEDMIEEIESDKLEPIDCLVGNTRILKNAGHGARGRRRHRR